MELQTICENTQALVIKVGDFIRAARGKVLESEIEEKDLNSLVSYVDKEAEKKLVSGLTEILPEATFLTEEETVEQTSGAWKWIIDPLDGTTNFLHEIPIFAISVALQHDDEVVVGLVYEVNQQELFYAWKDGGAYLNGKPIQASANTTLGKSLIATGFPYQDFDKLQLYFKTLEQLMRQTRGLRRLGAAAVDLVYVASGRFDAFFEYGLNPWDVAAGALIVQEAGGKVCDFEGGNDYVYGRSILASNAPLHDQFNQTVQSFFK